MSNLGQLRKSVDREVMRRNSQVIAAVLARLDRKKDTPKAPKCTPCKACEISLRIKQCQESCETLRRTIALKCQEDGLEFDLENPGCSDTFPIFSPLVEMYKKAYREQEGLIEHYEQVYAKMIGSSYECTQQEGWFHVGRS